MGLKYRVYTTTPNSTKELTRPGMTTVLHSRPIANELLPLSILITSFSLRETIYEEIPKILFYTFTMDLPKINTYPVHEYPRNNSQLPPNYPVTPITHKLPSKPNYPQITKYYVVKLLVIPRTTHFVQGITQIDYSYFYSKIYFGETQYLCY